ncbi:hypothetical protein K491DRAFT_253954 [Lophiostoma macrostomum CBS 122681]|uniref:Zn(2)-C6 fungal-type domain-containing protein n=1 Tax=Lophiostoma macrostomum CBS 122681 TaxID=1314788 RepID=A0A6A6TG44_9PLEO|nr:hypothetical protein K491DRAFT_253954 [Lophiostoma macrostomum CBS 122681]
MQHNSQFASGAALNSGSLPASTVDGLKPVKSNIACDRCREKKVRCYGSKPCRTCVNSSVTCIYSRTTRRYRGSSKEKAQRLQERLWQAERLLKTAGLVDPHQTPSDPSQHRRSGSTSSVPLIGHSTTQSVSQDDTPVSLNVHLGQSQALIDAIPSVLPPNGEAASPSKQYTDPSELTAREKLIALNTSESTNLSNEHASVYAGSQKSMRHDEIHGPTSFLTVCEDPGVAWISSRLGRSDYDTCAVTLVSSIVKSLKLSNRISQQRTPEPPKDVALLYAKAYFEECIGGTFYIIDRQNFEARLQRQNATSPPDDDPSWYALRNVVYASGCRHVTFKSQLWTEAQKRAQCYFENALSVETDLLHGTPRIMSVQALLAMAFFVDGSGSSKLEKVLLTCAIQVAQLCDLHLQPTVSQTSFVESQRRSWIFWTIYIFEKHLTLRSGRPSIIDDDDISCELPSWAPDSNPNIVEYFKCCVEQAQVSSVIAKSFLTAKARRLPLSQKIDPVRRIDRTLRNWYQALPVKFTTAVFAEPQSLPHGLRSEQILYLHFSYHGNMAATHSIFGHPWNVEPSAYLDDPTIQDQAIASGEALSHAARNIILATRWITVDASAPLWLVFFFPLLGMINMFVSILKHPEAASTIDDICLIDVAAGYFAYLEYTTNSALSSSFVRNIAHWVRQAAAKVAAPSQVEQESPEISADTQDTLPIHGDEMGSTWAMEDFDLNFTMNMEEWPAFLPRLPQFSDWE